MFDTMPPDVSGTIGMEMPHSGNGTMVKFH